MEQVFPAAAAAAAAAVDINYSSCNYSHRLYGNHHLCEIYVAGCLVAAHNGAASFIADFKLLAWRESCSCDGTKSYAIRFVFTLPRKAACIRLSGLGRAAEWPYEEQYLPRLC
eukprot:scaffold969_cov122-Skeletonema_dohrnii-CCMP3373.AAC.3